jgi:hypothetical protein
MKQERKIKFTVIKLTQGEIQDAMKHSVYRSKKHYTRKSKHKQKATSI